MIFSLIVLFSLVPFRRAGWFISKNFIYRMGIPFVIIFSIIWGMLIAYLVHILIIWQNPGLILKIIVGYGFGSYLSIPDYGLFNENTLTEEANIKHAILTFVGLGLFVLSTLVFSFLQI